MKLWLIRHAAVTLPDGLCYGTSDVPAQADATRVAAVAVALSMLGYRCCSDLDDLPPLARAVSDGVGGFADKVIKSGKHKEAVQAYLATIAYCDMNLGRLLDAANLMDHASALAPPESALFQQGLAGVVGAERGSPGFVACHVECGQRVADFHQRGDVLGRLLAQHHDELCGLVN